MCEVSELWVSVCVCVREVSGELKMCACVACCVWCGDCVDGGRCGLGEWGFTGRVTCVSPVVCTWVMIAVFQTKHQNFTISAH